MRDTLAVTVMPVAMTPRMSTPDTDAFWMLDVDAAGAFLAK